MYDHEYPPGEWTASGIATALGTGDRRASIPTCADEAAWERIRSDDLTGPAVEEITDRAARVAEEPFPSLPASRFLGYARSGERSPYLAVEADRWRRFSTLALAECFERSGAYLDPLLDAAWAICEQSTWDMPSSIDEELPRPRRPAERGFDLHGAIAARTLAELDYVFGDRLHPALRERIRHEVDRRVLTPFEARDDHPWMIPPVNNHNAVNNAGAAMAALYLEGPERAGRVVAKAAESLGDYLASFDHDGCTAEGFGYWSYGMMHYVLLTDLLAARTDGTYDLCSPPILERIAEYPLRVSLSPGRYVPYSDECEGKPKPPYPLCWLGERFDLPALAARGRREFADHYEYYAFPSTLRNLLWTPEAPEQSDEAPPERDFLSGYEWWFARANPADPDGLILAAKGGHNDESHNHNDCGTFVVHWRGESLLTDLGRHCYEAGYFGEERYEYLATRSLGHSVPAVNGYEQRAGAEYDATVLDHSGGDARETFELDLAGCYPAAAGVERLRRTVELDRDSETVRVADDAAFGPDAPGRKLESVLISYDPIVERDGDLLIEGARGSLAIALDGDAGVSVERLADAIDVSFTRDPESDFRDVWRARVEAAEASVTLTIDPQATPSTETRADGNA